MPASDGQLINGSEEACRDALGEFRRKVYEKAVPMRIAATEKSVAFSPSGPSLAAVRQSPGPKRLRPDCDTPQPV